MRRKLLPIFLGLFLALGCSLVTQASPSLKLGQPIDCTLGQNCFVLIYPDRDPGPDAVDVGCGRMTYDGHKGTDFAIPDERIMAQGVAVKAAAAGTVLRVRNDIPDQRIKDPTDTSAVEGMECGNGVVIDHGQEWETQYCHLRQGSVAVKPGDTVSEGSDLGLVGTSGAASFPHVHLSVRYQGQVVDPYVGPNADSGCQTSKQPLWKTDLPYQPTGLIRAGFAPQLPDLDQLWSGAFADSALAATSPAVVFWAQSYGVLQGDRERLQLLDPTGKVAAELERPLPQAQRVWVASIGKKNTSTALMSGEWVGQYQLFRDNQLLVDVEKIVRLE
ncbi:MAG: M23 family metallopeptidase [Cyanobacteria bacterium P01_A01_bin.17]